MALVTENNRQYYEGAQGYQTVLDQTDFTTTFDTNLEFLSDNPANLNYNLNNFKIYSSANGLPSSYSEINSNVHEFRVVGNTISFMGEGSTNATSGSPPGSSEATFTVPANGIIPKVGMKLEATGSQVQWTGASAGDVEFAILTGVVLNSNGTYTVSWDQSLYGTLIYGGGGSITVFDYFPVFPLNTYIVVQLKKLDGGKYGNTVQEKAYGNVVEENYGSYAYTKLKDIINAFQVAYVGAGKLIPSVKRTDVLFHAKRAMQEFSYDTLKSIKSQELTIPHNLSVILPQDYVNYVSIGWYDNQGVKHPIYPTNNLTQNPYKMPLQDNKGVPVQDVYDMNITGTSIVEERWRTNAYTYFNDLIDQSWLGYLMQFGDWGFGLYSGWGELYGMDPQYANANGWFNLNEREGKIAFSANLREKLIILEYISDGLAYDLDTRVPKMVEDAMYAAILYSIISTRANQPEYIVQRLKKDRYAKLRNAKIRLSNIKLEEITQVMRGKSKWIKH